MPGRARQELRWRSELLWETDARPSRGPKRGLTCDDVVRAAIRIADRDGIAALTMQAAAEELGFTTMALYRYFPSKEALIDAIIDAAMGTPPRRTGPNGGWRRELERWAHAKRAMMISRPWLAELPFVAAPHGPNWLSWVERAVEALSGTGLSAREVFDMLHTIDGYVRGGSDTAISRAKANARGMSDEDWEAAVAADLVRAVGNPRYPALSALITSGSAGGAHTLDDCFDFGLERVLDGIQAYVDSRSGPSTRRSKVSRRRQRASP
ncbi:MAG: TetR/AcrR family transcriptional regulator [Gemmatimonadaceae bacterium]